MEIRAYLYNDSFAVSDQVDLEAIASNYTEARRPLNRVIQAELRAGKRLWGGVELREDDQRFVYEDELVPLIQGFCLESIPLLMRNEVAHVFGFDHSGTLFLVPEGEEVAIHDDFDETNNLSAEKLLAHEPSMVVSKSALVSGQLKVARLFLKIWQQLSADHPEYVGLHKVVTALEDALHDAELSTMRVSHD